MEILPEKLDAEALLSSDAVPHPNDILASMQTMARSVHTAEAFGNIPHSVKHAYLS